MDKQEATGWAIVILILLAGWWLFTNGLSFLHGTVVQSGIALPGGQQNTPTVTVGGCTGC